MTRERDVLLVRPQGADDESWSASVEEWRQSARRLTGNRVEVVEADASDIARLLRGHKPLWKDIVRDGVVVFGKDLEGLRALRIA